MIEDSVDYQGLPKEDDDFDVGLLDLGQAGHISLGRPVSVMPTDLTVLLDADKSMLTAPLEEEEEEERPKQLSIELDLDILNSNEGSHQE